MLKKLLPLKPTVFWLLGPSCRINWCLLIAHAAANKEANRCCRSKGIDNLVAVLPPLRLLLKRLGWLEKVVAEKAAAERLSAGTIAKEKVAGWKGCRWKGHGCWKGCCWKGCCWKAAAERLLLKKAAAERLPLKRLPLKAEAERRWRSKPTWSLLKPKPQG